MYLFLDAFYSTGKTEVLKYFGKYNLGKGEIVHYFIQRPKGMDQNSNLLPFTLMLQKEFRSGVVKETPFQFGIDPVEDFLKQYEIEPTHHVIFDEVICTKYNKSFIDSMIKLKNSVASLWIAMGAQPIAGRSRLHYCKVASVNMSYYYVEAHPAIYRLLMKRKFDAYEQCSIHNGHN